MQAVVFGLVAVLLGQLWHLQLADGGAPQQRAAADRGTIRQVSLPAVRGRILDRAGTPLAANSSRVVLTADYNTLRRLDKPAREAVYARLGKLLRVDPVELSDKVGPSLLPVPLVYDVDPNVSMEVSERQELYPGIAVELRPTRYAPKPYGANAAQVIGYLGVDGQELGGRAGLEQAYDADLRGKPGRRTLKVNAAGRVIGVQGEQAALRGSDLVTSLDARVQATTERELRAAMRRARGTVDRVTKRPYEADTGAAVVLEARTGRVVALASEPTYDLGVWTGGLSARERKALFGEDSGSPLLSRATQGEYAPGSTFKPITTVAALDQGYPPSTTLPCPGTMRIGGRTFRNYGSKAYGQASFAKALAVSCDTFFYRIGVDLWKRGGSSASAVADTAAEFGLGRRTGIDLPGEGNGRLPDRAPYAGNAALGAIGQADLTVTPLQLASAYAALANGGKLWKPSVGLEVRRPDGSVDRRTEPQQTGRIPLTRTEISLLGKALRETTRTGTGAAPFAGFPLDRIQVASKTGTAEVAGRQTTSWFASYDKRYVVVMMVTQGGTGSGTSGPSVRRIWEALYGLGDRR
ncbi:penicillin-binding protein 2 [Flindersiella endophytica]